MPSGRLFDGLPFIASQGIHSLIKWKEHSLYKTSFDLVLYWMIMQNVKPDVIIELGSGDGFFIDECLKANLSIIGDW